MQLKKILLLLSVASHLLAQKLIYSGPAVAKAGQTITVTMSYEAAPAVPVSALQWVLPTNATVLSSTPSIIGKTVVTKNQIGMLIPCDKEPSDPTTVCNAAALPSATIQTFSFTMPTTAQPSDTFTIASSSAIGADTSPSANLVNIPVTALQVRLPSPYDLNSDGKVTMADVAIAYSQWQIDQSPASFTLLVQVIMALNP